MTSKIEKKKQKKGGEEKISTEVTHLTAPRESMVGKAKVHDSEKKKLVRTGRRPSSSPSNLLMFSSKAWDNYYTVYVCTIRGNY